MFMRLAMCMFVFSSTLYAVPNFQVLRPGFEHRSRASLGVIADQGMGSNYSNPALVEYKKNGFYVDADLSIIFLQHTYKHPDFEKFQLAVFAPSILLGIGYGVGPVDITLSLFPTGTGSKQEFTGLPVDLAQGLSAKSKVAGTQLGFETALGVSVELTKDLRLGISAVHSYQKTVVDIDLTDVLEEAPFSDFIEAEYKSSSFRFLAGFHYRSKKFEVAVAAELPKLITFIGESKTFNDADDVDVLGVETTDYQPLTLGAGFRYFWKRYALGLEYRYAAHEAGKDKVKTGLNPADAQGTNLQDSHSVGIHGDYQLSRRERVLTGVSYHGKVIGPTVFSGEGGPDNLGLTGLKFGDFAGLDRVQAGFGYEYQIQKNSTLGGGFDAAYGFSDVGSEFRGAGEYRLWLLSLNVSYSVQF